VVAVSAVVSPAAVSGAGTDNSKEKKVKRAKAILVVCFVILAVVVLGRDDGLIRTVFFGADTEVVAAGRDSGDEPADSETGSPGVGATGSSEDADPDAAETDTAETDTAETDTTGSDATETEPAAGDPNDSGEDQGDDDDGDFLLSFMDTSLDPNRPDDFGGGFDLAGGSDEDFFDELFTDEPMESVNLNNIEMKNIIQTLGEWTGKPIIPTSDEVMRTRITIYATKKVPRSRALALILAALKAKGVVAEQSDDKIFLKPIATARLGSVPTLSADEPLARITDKSQIVEKFFQLQNYSPTKLMSIITPLIAEYGHVTAMEDTGKISVIDTVDNLMRIERIIRQLDVPESEQVVEEIFEIQNGDPLEIVQVLEFILDTEGRYKKPKPRPPGSSGSGSGAKPATSVLVEQSDVPVRLIPIPKHNWIIARASAETMKEISKWIKQLDRVETVRSEQTVIQVRYADVREIEDALDNTIRQMPEEVRANVVVEPLAQARQLIVFGSAENRKMIEKLVAEMDLPRQDIYVEKTFKLKYADPDQIKENIDGLYGGTSPGGRPPFGYGYSPYSRYGRSGSNEENIVKVISYSTQGQVTVIASEKNMAKIERQITEEWDVPLDIEKDQYRILTLHNSDPVQMSNLLTKLFSEDSGSSSNLMRFIFGGRSDTQKKIVGSLYGMMTFEPVPDTKKIIVISKIPEAYDVIEKLIMELDSQEKAEVPRVITLNYADAEDLCDQLNAILNEPGTLATLQRSSRGLSDMDNSSGITSSGASSPDTNTGTITPWWTRQRSQVGEEMPMSNLIGQVRFVPVARSKAILVLAPPEYLADIEAMIAELDQPGMQVMIKVVIVEIDHSSMTSLGVQLATDSSLLNALTENGATILSTMAYADTFGAWTLNTGTNINTLVDLLVKHVNAKILNQPTLWTKDNEEAVFIKGKQVAFITNAQSDSSNITAVNESFEYNDVGLTLRVRPNITPEKAVDMTINLIISQVDPELINDEIAVSNLDTTTHLIINNGQTVMLGGILFQNDSTVKQKVPLLGDIPVVGNIFRHTERQAANDELLVFVTPYVIDANNLEAIPVDTDTDAQLRRPFRKMERIREHLDKAMEWLATEIGEDNSDSGAQPDQPAPEDTKTGQPQGEAIIEIKSDRPRQ